MVSSLLAAPSLFAEEEFAAKCPVSGKPAQKSVSVDADGKKVYFCCEGCPGAYEKDPAKFTNKVRLQWLATGQMLQVGCPFSGGPVNEDTLTDVGGAKVGFCCEKCQAKLNAAEDKLALAFGDISKGYTLQTTCPVSGKPVNLSKSVDYKGTKVYFCCGGCPAAFEKAPEKFAEKLPAAPK